MKRDPSCSLTVRDLVNQWHRQRGKCAFTGIAMSHTYIEVYGTRRMFTNASVDRIDSQRGYLKDNIQLICQRINFMKANLPDPLFFWACARVAQHRSADIAPLDDLAILDTHPHHATLEPIYGRRDYINALKPRNQDAYNAMNALVREEVMLRELLK